MEVFIELLKTCIPTIVGALIVIVPTTINKKMEMKQEREAQYFREKQQSYTRLIMLLTKVLRGQKEENYSDDDLDELINIINAINITGDLHVVKALDAYLKTWGKEEKDDQNKAYSELVKAIRIDLDINDKQYKEFPDIGLVEIRIKSNNK